MTSKSVALSPGATRRSLDGVLTLLGFFLLLTLAARLEATGWAEGLGVITQALLLGYGLGVLAGRTHWRWPFVVLLSVAYGLALLPLLLLSLTSRYAPLTERLSVLAVRVLWAWHEFIADRPVGDAALFLALMVLFAWTLGWFVGYALARHRALWRVLLPPLAALWVIHAYDPLVPTRAVYLLTYSGLAMLYLAWHTLGERRALWHRRRLLVPLDLGWDWMRVAFGVAVLVGFLAWNLPHWEARLPGLQEAWRQATRPWERWQRRLGRLVEPLQGATAWGVSGYAERLRLGTGVPETDTLVFRVEAPQAPLNAPHYWRVQAYTTYRRGVWEVQQAKAFAPEAAAFPRPTGAQETAVFRFVLAQPSAMLFTGLYPLLVEGVPYRFYGMPLSQGQADPLAFVADDPLAPGYAYQVREWVVQPTAEQLRRAGTSYPDWVRLYLQVPEDVPQRVRDLATALAQQADNPYDRARVVTAYLRAQIAYRNPLPAPPPKGQDPVDWFLFDAQEGFCTYYATAEVMLLRLMGIPARLAVGYAQGRYERGVYLVRERDSHAWPEVFFPGFGWVPFEPTVARPALSRPGDPPRVAFGEAPEDLLSPQELARLRRLGQGAEISPNPPSGAEEGASQGASPGEEAGGRVAQGWLGRVLGVLSALVVGFGLLWALQRPWLPQGLLAVSRRLLHREPRSLRRWLRWASLGEVDRAFWELRFWLRVLGGALPPGAGPESLGQSLSQRLPVARSAIEIIVQAYLQLHFAPPQKTVVPLAPVRWARRRLRRAAWRTLRRRYL